VVAAGGGAGRIAAIGITNQRETIVFWSRRTGRALAPAIVWQDRRTAGLCAGLKAEGHEEAVQAKTGLLLDPYFSASKIAWALANWPQLREAGADLCVGTVESWLVFKLTGGLHVSDATNASRTALMDVGAGAGTMGCSACGA
jgi:glycerol kinase